MRWLAYPFVRTFLLLLITAAFGCATQLGQNAEPGIQKSDSGSQKPAETEKTSDKINRPASEPYTGSLATFEDPKRDEKLQPDRVMDVLGIKAGSNVADIGAGSGWFTVRAARRAGPTGTIYAVDINPDYVAYIEDRIKRERLPNVRAVLSKADDPLLSAKSVDAVLLLRTYHEVAEPIRLLKRIREAMRPEACSVLSTAMATRPAMASTKRQSLKRQDVPASCWSESTISLSLTTWITSSSSSFSADSGLRLGPADANTG